MLNKLILKLTPLIYLSLLTFFIYILRFLLTGYLYYGFLLWNIFLAILPVFFALIFQSLWSNKSYLLGSLVFFVWLFFFPNSPYLFTDIIHFNSNINRLVPYWFDVIFYINISLIGFVSSFQSFYLILVTAIPKKFYFLFTTVISLLTGIGLYIGRELRFNSWDIFHFPFQILEQEIVISDLIPFVTIWPLCFIVWFNLGYSVLQKTQKTDIGITTLS
jgi:uncharacterized membrane protein